MVSKEIYLGRYYTDREKMVLQLIDLKITDEYETTIYEEAFKISRTTL